MERVVVIGSSGAGKSVLSRKLKDITNLPLYHLDNIFWREDRTHISRQEFDLKLDEILSKDKWIIDGDYSRTYEKRFDRCDTIIFLDYPLDVCLKGVEGRIGTKREDIPWVEDKFDEEFLIWIKDWHKNKLPILKELLEKYKDTKDIIILHSREESDMFLNKLIY